jgi:toxin YoeB
MKAFSDIGWEDYLWWQANDRKMLQRINLLIEVAERDPDTGIGKPERLREDKSGYWSRRITDEHRLVHTVKGDLLVVAACRYHYR